jgi:glutamyl-tRNA reductase
MNAFKIISLTHKSAPLELIGKLHLDENHQQDYLGGLKIRMDLKELMFLSTCNRVEFVSKHRSRDCSRIFIRFILLC